MFLLLSLMGLQHCWKNLVLCNLFLSPLTWGATFLTMPTGVTPLDPGIHPMLPGILPTTQTTMQF